MFDASWAMNSARKTGIRRGAHADAGGAAARFLAAVSTPATIVLSVLGVALIAIALRDVFDALFHESGKGVLSRYLMRGVWRVIRRVGGKRWLPLAGPFSLIAVVLTWAALLVLGWALLMMPHMPEDFSFSGASHSGRFVESVYVSLTTLTTVGFGDISPAADWVRLILPVEALVGFGLLTASVSWLLSIYPVLSRRRSLAYEVHLLESAQREVGAKVPRLEPGAAERVYAELTTRLVTVERDMVTFPVAYYFASTDRRFALPSAMPTLLALAEEGRDSGGTDQVRLRASMLRTAIGDFALTTAERFHGSRAESTDELLADYARDHLLS